MVFKGGRCGHVPVNAVIQGRNIGGPLNGRMPPKRQHTAAGPSDVAEKKLQQCTAADNLRTVCVMGPPHGISPGRGPVTARVLEDRPGNLEKGLLWTPCDLFHHPGRIAAEVAFYHLVNRTRVLQCFIPISPVGAFLFIGMSAAGVLPCGCFILTGVSVEGPFGFCVRMVHQA